MLNSKSLHLQNRNYYSQRHLETTEIEFRLLRTNLQERILILPKATLARTNTTNVKTTQQCYKLPRWKSDERVTLVVVEDEEREYRTRRQIMQANSRCPLLAYANTTLKYPYVELGSGDSPLAFKLSGTKEGPWGWDYRDEGRVSLCHGNPIPPVEVNQRNAARCPKFRAR